MITIAPLTVKDLPASPHVGRGALRENLEMKDHLMTRTKVDTGSVGLPTLASRLRSLGRSREQSYPLEASRTFLPSPIRERWAERGPWKH